MWLCLYFILISIIFLWQNQGQVVKWKGMSFLFDWHPFFPRLNKALQKLSTSYIRNSISQNRPLIEENATHQLYFLYAVYFTIFILSIKLWRWFTCKADCKERHNMYLSKPGKYCNRYVHTWCGFFCEIPERNWIVATWPVLSCHGGWGLGYWSNLKSQIQGRMLKRLYVLQNVSVVKGEVFVNRENYTDQSSSSVQMLINCRYTGTLRFGDQVTGVTCWHSQ